MNPGCYLFLHGCDPPILAKVTAIGKNHIEFEQFDDDRFRPQNPGSHCSPADFVAIGTHEQQKVFCCLGSGQSLRELQEAFEKCKDDQLAKEGRRLDREKRGELSKLLNRALNLPFHDSTLIAPGKPEDEDICLAHEWMNGQSSDSASEETRMHSARMAEKAIMLYYSERGEKPTDIAVLQLPEFASHGQEVVERRPEVAALVKALCKT